MMTRMTMVMIGQSKELSPDMDSGDNVESVKAGEKSRFGSSGNKHTYNDGNRNSDNNRRESSYDSRLHFRSSETGSCN